MIWKHSLLIIIWDTCTSPLIVCEAHNFSWLPFWWPEKHSQFTPIIFMVNLIIFGLDIKAFLAFSTFQWDSRWCNESQPFSKKKVSKHQKSHKSMILLWHNVKSIIHRQNVSVYEGSRRRTSCIEFGCKFIVTLLLWW